MATETGPDDPDRTELLHTRTTSPPPVDDGAVLPAGARLGRYRIEALLGRGGMGEVYRAEQLEPVRRTVALKLLRGRRLDARHRAYFEVERQLLAQMRHPAIAQVFDADTTGDGHPFFAMEFIAGIPVTDYCTRGHLDLRARCALMIRICEGVQHAHQKGVIHRDLKPGNLLVDTVDGRPLPKIIDFGIATAAAGGARGEVAGTPDYMSPEQAGGDPALVDTRSDVYALGVVLYELLTGLRPGVAGETVVDATRTLRLPSERLATLAPGDVERLPPSARGVPGLRRTLRHELDWVVARAMRHDRNARYASAAALADDLQRFLDGRPLAAVPATRRYVWGRFARRHRAALAAASVALVALLGGLGVSLYGLDQARTRRAIAETRRDDLEKVVAFQQSMLEGIDIESMGVGLGEALQAQATRAAPADATALRTVLGAIGTADIARGLIDRNLLGSAERAIDADFADQPDLSADLRESVARVRSALGLHAEAAAAYAKVAAQRVRAAGPRDAATLRVRLAQAESLAQAAEPEASLDLVRQLQADAAALPSDDALRLGIDTAEADAIAALGDRPKAKGLYEAIIARSTGAHGRDAVPTLKAETMLAILVARMGEAATGRALMEHVVATRLRTLGPEARDTLDAQQNLATMRVLSGDKPGAIALQRALVEIQSRRLGAEHPQVLALRGNLANMLVDDRHPEEALAVIAPTVEADVRVLGAQHPQTLRAKLNHASTLARLHRFDEALGLQAEVEAARTARLGPTHPDTLFIVINRAGTLLQAGRAGEALAQLREAVPLAQSALGPAHPQVQAAWNIRADASQALGRVGDAVTAYRALLAIRDEAFGARDARTVDTAWQLEGVLAKAGDTAEAARLRARYVAPLLAAAPASLDAEQARMAENIRTTEAEERKVTR